MGDIYDFSYEAFFWFFVLFWRCRGHGTWLSTVSNPQELYAASPFGFVFMPSQYQYHQYQL